MLGKREGVLQSQWGKNIGEERGVVMGLENWWRKLGKQRVGPLKQKAAAVVGVEETARNDCCNYGYI